MKDLNNSDKVFWHRYLPFYEEEFKGMDGFEHILEFGVFKGASIRWLFERFPKSMIHAADILPVQEEWPIHDRIQYYYVDQDSKQSIIKLFKAIDTKLDLIIEDGSHRPVHQKNCLIQGLNNLNPGGVYILEDLQTSHPGHIFYKELRKKYFGPYHLLLALEHQLATFNKIDLDSLINGEPKSLFSKEELGSVVEKIKSVKIYKRSTLPLKCYRCGSSSFNYIDLKCSCGIGLMSESDSISAVIHLK
ncbi:class I SAM-dependent methyltransferase [Winogradskyella aurantiaca]|uniref:hypothetical protein n=1 Tax=Winogradskyella aurantiaca TaxID=2219558 RepID=UPI000E1D84BF|nr:hypothetical protein [Winogradskyella aurantiaca]